MKKRLYRFSIFFSLLISCTSSYPIVKHEISVYIMNDSAALMEDSVIKSAISPYKAKLDDSPLVFYNSDGNEILIAQVGWAGIKLGKIDYYFSRKNKKTFAQGASIKISDTNNG